MGDHDKRELLSGIIQSAGDRKKIDESILLTCFKLLPKAEQRYLRCDMSSESYLKRNLDALESIRSRDGTEDSMRKPEKKTSGAVKKIKRFEDHLSKYFESYGDEVVSVIKAGYEIWGKEN